MPERRPIADPLRGRRGPVARQRIDATGVLHTQSTEIRPCLIRILELKSSVCEAPPCFLEFLALDADLRVSRQLEVLHEIFDAVATHRATQFGPSFWTILDRGEHKR